MASFRRPEWHWLDWVGSLTGHHWSWAGALVLGAGQVMWILLELASLPEATWLQAVYGSVGSASSSCHSSRQSATAWWYIGTLDVTQGTGRTMMRDGRVDKRNPRR